MKFKLILFTLLFSSVLLAQSKKQEDWIVKLNLPKLLDITTFSALEVSLEKKISQKFSINTEIGVKLFNRDRGSDTIFNPPKGFKINTELRYYLSTEKNNGFYVGLQAYLRDFQYNKSLKYETPNDIGFKIDNFGVKKQVYGLNITAGLQHVLFKKMIIEPYIGTGIGNRTILFKDLDYNKETDKTLGKDFKTYAFNQKTGAIFNFTFGFRVGYVFKN